jgi:hypothetical protein
LQERFGCSFRTQAVLQYGLLFCHRQFADGGIEFEEERLTNPERKKDISLSIYIMWHIWKERGRRIFQNESMSAPALARLIRADSEMVTLANGIAIDP